MSLDELKPLEETQSETWEEVKQLYREKLEVIPYVRKGYINISAPHYADVMIVLSSEVPPLVLKR